MIELSMVRLINWYAFSNMTAPVGMFTLVAGQNGNGKSVLLDAIKYGLYGDSVFNKSTENKGSRTVTSYTRGLLDATAGSYMRPADKVPNVYTHIVLEMHEKELDRYFILGTVIETNAGNGFVTQRYVMEGKRLSEIEHTYAEGKQLFAYSASQLHKKYGFKLLSATEGLGKFMQRTGLRLNEGQLAAFRRKLRSVMSYDPNAKIDEFIRESVLEEKKVDFSKLIETKNNIDILTGTFETIDAEINELENILNLFEELKRAKNIIFADDVKGEYQRYLKAQEKMETTARAMCIAQKQIEEDTRKLEILEEKDNKTALSCNEAKFNRDQMDCSKAINEANEALLNASKRKEDLKKAKDQLLEQQNRISELINWLYREKKKVNDKEILSSLTLDTYSGPQKESCVENFIGLLKKYRDKIFGQTTRIKDMIRENEKEQEKYQKTIDDCNMKKTNYSDIPQWVSLKNQINKEFRKRGIASEARFACEYVIGLADEEWRDTIEGYLGQKRYTILVEPEYYDLADDILNASKNKYAHLFNTKLLMKKSIKPVEDSVAKFIEIRNPIARKYFDYQLGRFHATTIDQVRKFENAMSKEGRVAVSMDGYFIRTNRIRYYYLGQETLELNRRKAERQLNILKEEKRDFQQQLNNENKKWSYLDEQTSLFVRCNYNACREYEESLGEYRKRKVELQELKAAQDNNMEYIRLAQMVEDLEQELLVIREEMKAVRDDRSRQDTEYQMKDKENKAAQESVEQAEIQLREYSLQNNAVYSKAIRDYKNYLENGQTGLGGMRKDRPRAERAKAEAEKNLKTAQYSYNAARTAENQLPITEIDPASYQSRKDKIWMDDRQEIQEKLKEQTRRYEAIFKNEFVLTVLKSCETAKSDLRLINAELARLKFKSLYEFDVHYIRDGSDYEKILDYARYLKEREELGTAEGQMTFETMTSYSDSQGDELEVEMKKIINRVVSSNDKEKIERYADYRNYMNYEILISNDVLHKAKLSKQSGFNSGAEVQIPYILILLSALLMIYNDKNNSTRLVFIDEPFAKMDPVNVKIMLGFMKEQKLQMIFCAPDKTDVIGDECNVILPVLRRQQDLMEIGVVEMHGIKD